MQLHRILLLLLIGYWLFFPALIEWWFLLQLAPEYTFFCWFIVIALSFHANYKRRTE